jgi:hypothetical protein
MAEKDVASPVSTSSPSITTFSQSSTAINAVWDKTKVPFEKDFELCKDLDYCRDSERKPVLRSHAGTQTLPDAPRVYLNCTSRVVEYCTKDMDTPGLNKLGEKLWWAGPTPAVVPLSQHYVLERRIQITEDPSVHLLWVEGILYVKPIPAYLTCFAFWEFLMDESETDESSEDYACLIATCLGFLKTYASLVQRRSDFNLAKNHGLLESLGDVSFEQFIAFIACFDNVPDLVISSRWRYGLIQLDALNFHSSIHLRRWHLNRFEARYATYFSRFFPVVLFVFALFSVVLSAMQVIIAAKQIWDTDNKGLKKVLKLFVWFGTEAIGWSLGMGGFFVFWWFGIMGNEVWARRRIQRRIKKRLKAEADSP